MLSGGDGPGRSWKRSWMLIAALLPTVFGDFPVPPARTSTLPSRSRSLSISRTASTSRITPAPRLGYLASQQLFGRQASQTVEDRFCAYADGDGASPLYCPTGYTCTYVGNGLAFGCCNQRGCVNAPRTCINGGETPSDCSSWPGLSPEQCTSIFLSVYTSILFCSGNQPACQTYILKTNTFDPQDTKGVPSWTCGASQTEIFVYTNALTNAGAQVTFSDTPPTASPNSPNQSQKSNPTNTAPNASTGTSKPSGDTSGDKKSVDTGTIIGAVVGAIGVLVTVLVTLFPRQMTRLVTCGLRPKKDYTNGEIRNLAWAYVTGQVSHTHTHMHTHTHVHLQSQPSLHNLQQHQPAPQQQLQWNQGQWNQGSGGSYADVNTGYAGYATQPAPAYQPHAQGGQGQHAYSEYADYAPGYAVPQGYQLQEQRRPFLDTDDRKL
ncbi:hypothetical protein Dda_3147 [Drechslerella dactyloides]|uniref:Uncharacterized protein n=1 Tax=Drechslerella dactyloides TaxID=74499 RepID=A0AAD6J0Y0_DREDA|nr:hypothetical protein Dda_3147 [Drechslerella dactyloides]